MTSAYSGNLAAGQSVTTSALTLTSPFRGIQVQQTVQFASGYSDQYVYISYQLTSDGINWSDPVSLGGEVFPNGAAARSTTKSILLNRNASSIRFTIRNADPVYPATLNLQIGTFA